MIDNLAILLFGSLIVYTVLRAIKFDVLIPWFSEDSTAEAEKLEAKRNAKKK